MQFAESNLIWLLILVPLIALLRYYSYCGKFKDLSRLACNEVIEKIFIGFKKYNRYSFWQGVITVIFTLLLVITALRPQYGFVWRESKRKGVNIVVAVDVSLSMLSEDVKPNRLQRAKREIYDLLENLRGDRIALVAFSGVAFTESPLTEDYSTFRLFLKLLDTSLVPIPGTNIGAALDKSIEAFGSTEAQKKAANSQAILLITDGEDLDGEYQAASKKAAELGIKIFILGIGTKEGAPINTPNGYKKDDKGTIIISRLNEEVLKQLAKDTGGIYVESIVSEADTELIYKMGIKKQLEDQNQQAARAKRWNEYYQFPLFIALVIMLWPTTNRALRIFRQYVSKKKIITRNITAINIFLLFFFIFPNSILAQNKEQLGKEASDSYKKGDFNTARHSFDLGTQIYTGDYRFLVGGGAANYRLGDYKQSARQFLEAVSKTKDPKEQAKALYNSGNALVQLNQLEDAINTYEESLKIVPDDKNTIENLAYAKRLLEQQNKEQKETQKKDQKDQQKKDQKDQQNNENQDKNQNEDQQQDQKQDNSDQQKSDQNSSAPESKDKEQDKSKPELNKQQNSQQQDQASDQSQETSNKEENNSDMKDSFNHQDKEEDLSQQQTEALLNGIEENRNNFMNYRKQEAIEQLKKMGKNRIVKDW